MKSRGVVDALDEGDFCSIERKGWRSLHIADADCIGKQHGRYRPCAGSVVEIVGSDKVSLGSGTSRVYWKNDEIIGAIWRTDRREAVLRGVLAQRETAAIPCQGHSPVAVEGTSSSSLRGLVCRGGFDMNRLPRIEPCGLVRDRSMPLRLLHPVAWIVRNAEPVFELAVRDRFLQCARIGEDDVAICPVAEDASARLRHLREGKRRRGNHKEDREKL
jgi:hypothetical protein